MRSEARRSTPAAVLFSIFALLAVFAFAACGDEGVPDDDVANGVVGGVEDGAEEEQPPATGRRSSDTLPVAEPSQPSQPTSPTEPPVPPDTAPAEGLVERADSAVAALERQDWDALAEMAHPERGVRFSPYGYVDTAEHVVLTREEIANAPEDQTEYHWGQYDGRGNDIRLTIEEYYEEFIYNVDFADARRGEPDEVIGTGNTLVNLEEAYPGPNTRFIEYHDPGTDEYEGMDWNSLRLIFERTGGEWLLVGIAHDEWTI